MRLRIVDLDNCISDDGWRIPRIEWQHAHPMDRYHTYHSLSPWDKVGNRDIFTGHSCVIATARPLLYRAMTLEWLMRASVPFVHLLMRNDNDVRPSLEVKRTQMDWLFNFYGVKLEDIEMAFDDRPDVVEMYRSLGIRAEMRRIHEIDAYNRGKETHNAS